MPSVLSNPKREGSWEFGLEKLNEIIRYNSDLTVNCPSSRGLEVNKGKEDVEATKIEQRKRQISSTRLST